MALKRYMDSLVILKQTEAYELNPVLNITFFFVGYKTGGCFVLQNSTKFHGLISSE